MLESKRPRSPLPLRRTTSMKDVSAAEDQEIPASLDENSPQQRRRTVGSARSAGDFPAATIKISPFLADCSLCNSHLLPCHDIFMYRGEAFCSLKCRQQLINHDIKKEKLKLFLLISMKKKASAQANSQASKASSAKPEETMAAA